MSGIPVVGRDAEIQAIADAVEAVALGGRRLLVVQGEAGIGKTRLLEVIREQAASRRFSLLEGRATELESDVPLAPVVEALEPALRELPASALQALDAEQLRLLSGVLPGIGDAPVAAWAPASPAERWRLHRALRDLLDVLGGLKPVALVLDDAHWADPATLELLDHIVRRPPGRAHLLAVALRPGEAADRLAAARRSTGLGVELDLAPLDRSAADLLLTGVAEPAERDRLFQESGGNPLLLEELALAGASDELPDGVVAAVGAELRGLSPVACALLDGAAVVGDPFDFDLAAAVAGLARDKALGALDVLVDQAIVRRTSDPWRFAFRHPVIRSAVYEAMPAGARLARHEAAARALSGAALPLRARHLAQVAAPGDVEAATTLRAAAGVVRPQAPAIAADWLLAARRADPGGGTEGLSTLAEVLIEAGRPQAALELVDEAVAEAGDGDPQPLVRLAIAGAGVERLLGRHTAAKRRLERALEQAPASGRVAARLMADLAIGAYQRGDYGELARWAEQASEAPEADPIVRSAASALLAVTLVLAGDRAASDEAVRVALSGFDAASDDELLGAGELLTAVPWGVLAVERLEEGLAVGRRCAEVVRRGGNGPVALGLEISLVLALGLLGRVTEAVEAADLAEQAARVIGNDQAVQWTLWMHAWALNERGELDGALVAAEESVALAERIDDSALVTISRAVLGSVLVAHGRFEEGRPLLAAYDVDPAWICRWTPPLVEAEIALGDIEAAAAHAARASGFGAEIGLAGARAAAGRAEALVALARGNSAAAAELALGAATDAESIDSALEAARSRVVVGRALAASDRDAAIRALAEAERQAAAAGAQRVRDEAVRELRRLGQRVGRGGKRAEGDHGLATLSTREREIAELVADGHTNREIAGRLFLSEKTIETHLSRVFGKLAVRSRSQVAAAVAARR